MNTLLITAMALLMKPDSGLQLTFVDTIIHRAEFIATDARAHVIGNQVAYGIHPLRKRAAGSMRGDLRRLGA